MELKELRTGSICQGFKLLKITTVSELDSTGYEFVHEKSGARLFYLQNEDDNKVFSISFRTTPKDNTGVAHIVEHSTLCGSRKFPSKEPFVELAKGSLNTFLNAMTYPDKTMYPVASQNDKDFQNLMDVYLDAVFHPLMTTTPEVLMQEGWHYEIDTQQDSLRYSGVVYNEMKGALSSPEELLESRSLNEMFPDNTYAFESGGNPDYIPDLTQQMFVDFHKRYYHPANSYIFLYGKLDLEEKLAFIDGYLSDFTKIEVDSKIPLQKPFAKEKRVIAHYPIGTNEDKKEKTFLSFDFVTGTSLDVEKCIALDLLDYALLKSQAAPLRNRLIKEKLGTDISSAFDNGLRQPWWTITVTGSEPERAEKFRHVLFEAIEELVQKGIDKKLLRAAYNINEFKMREADFGQWPKGLIYNILLMKSWLYDGDPTLYLCYDKVLSDLKKKIDTDYFEKLLAEVTLNNPHRMLISLEPDNELSKKREAQLEEKLKKIKDSMTKEQIDELIAAGNRLKLRQQTPDSPEVLKTIPLLQLEDIDKQAKKFIIAEDTVGNAKVLRHDINTNGIAYVDMYFDASVIEQSLLPKVYFLVDILKKVATENYSYADLASEIDLRTGGISFDLGAYAKVNEPMSFLPKLIIHSRSLINKLPDLFALIEEIILSSDFSDKERLRELAVQEKSGMELDMLNMAQSYASARVLSHFTPGAAYMEAGKLSFYSFIKDLVDNFDARYDELCRDLHLIMKRIFAVPRLLTSVTMKKEYFKKFAIDFNKFTCNLSNETHQPCQYTFNLKPCNEGFESSSRVQYVFRGANFIKSGFKYTGHLDVLSTIMRYTYLWNELRVVGGAYGMFARFNSAGDMYFGSYRDPHLSRTLSVYDKIADYLRNFAVDDREMLKYIIGTISNIDVPLTPSGKGKAAATAYICGITDSLVQKKRNEILSTRQSDIAALAKLVEKCLANGAICVIGNEAKIQEDANIFQKTCNIFDVK